MRNVAPISPRALMSAILPIITLPLALSAQSIQTVPPQQGVWQAGDNPARAAQAHGQEDDITVLTVTFAPAEVLHA